VIVNKINVDTMSEERIENEKAFHNKIFENKSREKVGRYYAITKSIHDDFDKIIYSNPKVRVLEYGCGMGESLAKFASSGADAHGIDISDFAINELQEKADSNNLNIKYQVMNAEDLQYEDKYFDLIFGTGILHHLDLEKSFKTISEKLNKNGKAIFIEPLGHNFFINKYRNKTPDIRTVDEHPLLMNDLQSAKEYFDEIVVKHYYLTSLAIPIFFKKDAPKILIKSLDILDSMIFTVLPFMKRYSWQVLIEFKKG